MARPISPQSESAPGPDARIEPVGGAERMLLFTDAVVAIALTLLALELPVPTGETTHEFLHSIRHGGGEYLAFLISFLVIARAWSHHDLVFDQLERIDRRFRSLNTLWLMTIVLIPFTMKLLTVSGGDERTPHAMRWGFFALVQVVESLTLLAMIRRMSRKGLSDEPMPFQFLDRTHYMSFSVLLGFGLSIPLFFVWSYAWILWILAPFVTGQIARRNGWEDERAQGPRRGGRPRGIRGRERRTRSS